MKKLHLTPITVHLLKSSQRDIKDFAEVSLIQIEDNTLSFRSNMYYEMSQNRKAQHTLKKLGANLKKYNNKYSHKLHLYFNKNCGLNQTVCWDLGSSIAANFRDLREFTLSFFMCDDLTDEGLRYLLMPISKIITRVRKLTIDICRCQRISNKGLESIESLLLVHAKMLRKLSFNCSGGASFWSNQKIVPTEINIAARIRNYANVRKVYPFYLASPISYQGILKLTKTVAQYLKNLEQFTFIPLLNENQKDLCTIFFYLISRLRRLRVFCLGFYSYGYLIAEYIDNITRSIGKNLLNLEYLTLDFKDEIFAFEVTDHLLAQMPLNIFSNLPLLRGLALGFNNYKHTSVTSAGMTSFVREICQYAKCLEELVIDIKFAPGFSSSIMHLISKNLCSLKRFTSNGWSTEPSLFTVRSKPELSLQAKGQLASKLTCPNLKELNLYFNTSDQGPFLFSESLEKLTLSFPSCREMTDRYFELLASYIFDVPLRNLQELTLIFNQASKISDNEIKILSSQGLIHLTNLRSLRLKFSESNYITDAALKCLEVPIQESLKNLKTFDLTFQNCEMISERGIKSLVSAITRNLLNLEKLRLDFFNKKGILSLEQISATIDRIARELKKLKKLELDFSFGADYGRFSYYNNSEAWLTERVRKQLKYISVVRVHCFVK